VVVALGSFTTIVGMTLILPILPLYVGDLGVTDPAAVTTWSGVAYAATFLSAALTAPLWGRLGDRYGRKPMLIRASLGMAVAMSLIGLAQNVAQLVLLRLLAGLLGGYASGSTILVAAQTPKDRSAWALGVLSSAVMAGNVAGPLLGGTLEQAIGIKRAFLVTGGLIFVGFLATALLLKEQRRGPAAATRPRRPAGWAAVPRKPVVLSLLGLSALLMFATVSVEPIITVHVERLTGSSDHVALFAAIVFSATALGAIVSAPRLGQLADRVGRLRVLALSLAAATVLLACQSFAPGLWTFAALRFLTGLALGGVTPTVVATIRHLLPGHQRRPGPRVQRLRPVCRPDQRPHPGRLDRRRHRHQRGVHRQRHPHRGRTAGHRRHSTRLRPTSRRRDHGATTMTGGSTGWTRSWIKSGMARGNVFVQFCHADCDPQRGPPALGAGAGRPGPRDLGHQAGRRGRLAAARGTQDPGLDQTLERLGRARRPAADRRRRGLLPAPGAGLTVESVDANILLRLILGDRHPRTIRLLARSGAGPEQVEFVRRRQLDITPH
jgi:MFS family permease